VKQPERKSEMTKVEKISEKVRSKGRLKSEGVMGNEWDEVSEKKAECQEADEKNQAQAN